MNWANTSSFENTRLIVFAENLTLGQGEPPSAVTVFLTDSNNQNMAVPAEQIAPASIPGLDLKQIVFRLPSGLAAGTCSIRLVIHNQISNSATFRIAP